MRKTLFAMLGLVALGLWALPAVAAPVAGGQVVDGPKTTGSSQRQPQPELSARL